MSFESHGGDSVRSLERYFSVLSGDAPAKFRICKKITAEVDFHSDINSLWRVHDRLLNRERELVEKIDGGEKKFEDISSPEKSLLDLKAEIADRILEECHFCEHRCGVDRKSGERGFCGVGAIPRLSSEFVHRGEEIELVPSYTIFFSGCTFECQFCQNWSISQDPNRGEEAFPDDLSSGITSKWEAGVKNVNWVGGDPAPDLHTVLSTLNEVDVDIPSVWNSNMYLTEEGMKLLSGTHDIYLTDFKYGNDDCALKYSKISDYWETVTRNHEIAHEDSEMIIRHLVLPNHVECCTRKILEWVSDNLSKEVRINLMSQYRPVAKANDFPELSRRVSKAEMSKAHGIADDLGLKNIVG